MEIIHHAATHSRLTPILCRQCKTYPTTNGFFQNKRFLFHLTDTSVVEGDKLSLCVEVEGYPEPSVEWMKNGKVVAQGMSYESLCVETSDSGKYSVIVKNTMGEVKEDVVVIIERADKQPVVVEEVTIFQ